MFIMLYEISVLDIYTVMMYIHSLHSTLLSNNLTKTKTQTSCWKLWCGDYFHGLEQLNEPVQTPEENKRSRSLWHLLSLASFEWNWPRISSVWMSRNFLDDLDKIQSWRVEDVILMIWPNNGFFTGLRLFVCLFNSLEYDKTKEAILLECVCVCVCVCFCLNWPHSAISVLC